MFFSRQSRSNNNDNTNVQRLFDALITPFTYTDNIELMGAIKLNDTKLVKIILDYKSTDPSFNNSQALTHAVTYKCLDIIDILLQDGRVKLNSQDNMNIFRLVIKENKSDILVHLLKYKDANPGTQSDLSYSPLIDAITQGRYEIVELLLKDHRVKPSENNNKAIKYAVKIGNEDIVRLLLTYKWRNVNPSVDGNTLIICASSKGYGDIVKMLLAEPSVDPSEDNSKALQVASEYGHRDVVELLLKDDRVNPNAANHRALLVAIKNNYVDIVKMLLQSKWMNLNKKVKRLMAKEVVLHNSNNVSKYLFDLYGTEWTFYLGESIISLGQFGKIGRLMNSDMVKDKNLLANYMVMTAVSQAKIDVVKYFLVDKKFKLDTTYDILEIATATNNYEIVKTLLDYPGLDSNSVKNSKAIIIASTFNYVQILVLLLQDGRVDPTNAAIRIATILGNVEALRLLIKDKRVDATFNDNTLIKISAKTGNLLSIVTLMKDKKVFDTVNLSQLAEIAKDNNQFETAESLKVMSQFRQEINI